MKILFIGGTGRCGTNVAKYLLDLHRDVFSFPFEIRFLIDDDGLCEFYRCVRELWTPQKIQVRSERLKMFLHSLGTKGHEGRYKDWDLSRDAFEKYYQRVGEFLGELESFSFDGFWDWMRDEGEISYVRPRPDVVRRTIKKFFHTLLLDVVEQRGLDPDRAVYVDDGTYNMFYVHILQEIFPTARFLHMTREPVQVIGSMMDSGWCPSDASQAAKWYVDSWNEIKRSMGKADMDRCMELELRTLVTSPVEMLKKICQLVGLDMNPEFIEKINSFDLSKMRTYKFTVSEEEEIGKILVELNK